MQTVKIKEVKSITGTQKSGKNAGKPWELIILITEDGSELTSFDLAVKEVGEGGIIEVETEMKAGKANIKEFKIIEKGGAGPETGSKNSRDREVFKKDLDGLKIEYQYKAVLDSRKNAAFAAQKAFEGGISLIDLIDKLSQKEQEKYVPLIDAALAWGLTQLTQTDLKEQLGKMPHIDTPKKEEEVEELWPEDKEKAIQFKNPGEFFTYCNQKGVTRSRVLGLLGLKEGDDYSNIKYEDALVMVNEEITANKKAATKS